MPPTVKLLTAPSPQSLLKISQDLKIHSLKLYNIAPKNGGFQLKSPFPVVYFQGRTDSFREGKCLKKMPFQQVFFSFKLAFQSLKGLEVALI